MAESPPMHSVFNHIDEYRVGIIGSSGVGKTSLAAKFHRRTGTNVNLIHRSTSTISADSYSVSGRRPQTSQPQNDSVISVVVTKSGPLGVKLGPHRSFKGFISIQSFVRAANGEKYELEKEGRLQVGDLLVAINRCTLVNISKRKLRETLDNFTDCGGPRVLTFMRPSQNSALNLSRRSQMSNPSSSSAIEDEEHSSICETSFQSTNDEGIDMSINSNITHGVYIEKPSVNIRLSSLALKDRLCRLELIDIPGNDYESATIHSWIYALDGIVAVYSADSITSFMLMVRRYGQLLSNIYKKDMHQIPIVIVCNKVDTVSEHKEELIHEGRTLAEAWGAAFFEHSTADPNDLNITEIFTQIILEVDKKSPVSSDGDSASLLSLSSIVATCITDGCTNTNPSLRRRTRKFSNKTIHVLVNNNHNNSNSRKGIKHYNNNHGNKHLSSDSTNSTVYSPNMNHFCPVTPDITTQPNSISNNSLITEPKDSNRTSPIIPFFRLLYGFDTATAQDIASQDSEADETIHSVITDIHLLNASVHDLHRNHCLIARSVTSNALALPAME